MRKNMKKLTVATVIGAMTVTALAPVSAQAKDKTLTVATGITDRKPDFRKLWMSLQKRPESKLNFR